MKRKKGVKKAKLIQARKSKAKPLTLTQRWTQSWKRYLVLTIFSIGVGCATGDVRDAEHLESAKGSLPAPTETNAPLQVPMSSNEQVQSAGSLPIEASPAPLADVSANHSPDSTLEPVASDSSPKSDSKPGQDESLPAPVNTEASASAATPTPASTEVLTATPAPASTEVLAPTATPAPVNTEASMSPAIAPVQAPEVLKSYQVKRNDTLMKISFKLYGNPYAWDEIFQLNQEVIKNPNLIRQGISLKYKPATVPVVAKSGHKYKIKAGDTLSSISMAVYGTTHKWKAIWEKNNDIIHNPSKIMAGLVIYYSGGHRPVLAVRPALSNQDEEVQRGPAPASVQKEQGARIQSPLLNSAPVAAEPAAQAPAAQDSSAVVQAPAAPMAHDDGQSAGTAATEVSRDAQQNPENQAVPASTANPVPAEADPIPAH